MEYQGKKYKALTFKHDRYINIDVTEYCFVVETEVPLLLINNFGKKAEYDGKKDLICCNYVYYATEENYDEYNKILREGKLDYYRSYKYVVDEEKQQVFTEYYVLDEKTTEVIKNTLNNVVSKEVKDFGYAGVEFLRLDASDGEVMHIERKGAPIEEVDRNHVYRKSSRPKGEHGCKSYQTSGKEFLPMAVYP